MILNKIENLLFKIFFVYDLSHEIEIPIFDYVKSALELENFCATIREAVKKSGYIFVEQVFILTIDKNVWVIKIK